MSRARQRRPIQDITEAWKAEAWEAGKSKEMKSAVGYHAEVRTLLRIVGPLVLGVGVVLIAIGMIDFFSSMGSFEPPRYFWCFFAGMPFVAVGSALTRFAYMGMVYRYMSREVTPVATETFNEVANRTRDGAETIAHAVGRGLRSGIDGLRGTTHEAADEGLICTGCKSPNPPEARFCNQCGATFEDRACRACGTTNPPQSRFCTECGGRIEA